ncbi:3-dehydroquinate dehydratase [Vallitalea longa]|uniref:3-dehydroquinate dehydratase n=1 Tax=Vallitalea longa TaxID=2936439 RepID=A0A9W5YHA2_9FIRM|nr:type II 3-dehydroquinate dehydratase [Vallitalea longa]GKX31914.1 3-dehydroquinate dehydratase [Vallitalea longa]
MKKITVINGPNLNFLGIREKSVYGNRDYNDLIKMIEEAADKHQIEIDTFQSNSEGEIIDKIQQCYFEEVDGIVINPGAYTHYSYAIRDAIASVNIKTIELHISNIHEREDFRKISVIEPVCAEQIYGKGLDGYIIAIEHILK